MEDYIVSFLGHQIYLAPVILLIVEESGIPIPVPGDIIIAFIGYEVSRGLIPYFVAFIMILCSVLIGASILYFLSTRYGERIIDKFGNSIHLDRDKLHSVEGKFKKYGPLVIIFGRHVPGFRIPITVFSGISKVTYKTFILSTFISVIFWIAFYLEVGRQLGPRTVNLLKAHHLFYVFFIVGILFVIGYVWILVRKRNTDTKNTDK